MHLHVRNLYRNYIPKTTATLFIVSTFLMTTMFNAYADDIIHSEQSHLKQTPLLIKQKIGTIYDIPTHNSKFTHFMKIKHHNEVPHTLMRKHLKGLDLSDTQKDAIKDIRSKYKEKLREMKSDQTHNDIVKKTVDMLKKESVLRKDVMEIQRMEMSKVQERTIITVDMYYDIISVLNKEQRHLLAEKIEKHKEYGHKKHKEYGHKKRKEYNN